MSANVHVSVLSCICTCVHFYVCVHMCVEVPGILLVSSLLALIYIINILKNISFQVRVPHCAWSSPIQIDGLLSKPQPSLVSASLALRVQTYIGTPTFLRGLNTGPPCSTASCSLMGPLPSSFNSDTTNLKFS